MAVNISIRPLSKNDDMGSLTNLIHAAYRALAKKNLKFWATHQTVEDTLKRFSAGHGLLAEVQGVIVGTMIVRPPQPGSEVDFYRDPNTWTLNQFAVQPEMQGNGIGRKLHECAIEYAASNHGSTIALDTAVSAIDLIKMYERWGYKIVGECDWRPLTNYLSVILAKPIFNGSHKSCKR